MDHFIFLLGRMLIFSAGECFFFLTWRMLFFFSPFDIILMVPLKYTQPSRSAPPASTLCHLVNGRQGLNSEKQRTG